MYFRGGVLRTQKLKTHLSRTKTSKTLPLKPGVGQNIDKHASPTAKEFSLELISTLPVHSPAFFPKSLPRYSVLAVANAGSCVGLLNIIGHPACRSKELLQVPVLRPTEYKQTRNMR